MWNRGRATPAAETLSGSGTATGYQWVDRIAVDLQEAGLTFRKARKVVREVFRIWRAALARQESVETPVGMISVAHAKKPRVHENFGKSVMAYRRSWQVAFEPWRVFDAEEDEEDGYMTPDSEDVAYCERCGGYWLMEARFNQYLRGPYGSFAGADLQARYEVDRVTPLRICLLWESDPAQLPKTTRKIDDEVLLSFLDSVRLTRAYWNERVEKLAMKEDVERLTTKIERLHRMRRIWQERSKVFTSADKDRAEP